MSNDNKPCIKIEASSSTMNTSSSPMIKSNIDDIPPIIQSLPEEPDTITPDIIVSDQPLLDDHTQNVCVCESFSESGRALDRALQIVQRMQEREESKLDEFDVFGQSIAHGLRKLKTETMRTVVANQIYNILCNAIVNNNEN